MNKKVYVAKNYSPKSAIARLLPVAEKAGFYVDLAGPGSYIKINAEEMIICSSDEITGYERLWSENAVEQFILNNAVETPEPAPIDPKEDAIADEPELITPVLLIVGEDDDDFEEDNDDFEKDMEAKHIVIVDNAKFGTVDIMSDGEVDLNISDYSISLKLK